jgi:tetratricopeptide (TPR) repeat protein
MKAFLSHSSVDKQLVEAVANELGRQYCVYDARSFDTGDMFKRSIERGLDESSVFVLFASRKALESVWVKFEADEAWFGKLRGSLATSLVYLIEGGLSVDDLPEWLRRAKVIAQIAPKIISRDIRHHLDDLLMKRQQPFFVGRSKDAAALEQALTPVDGSPAPRAAFVTGLPGIGRRSLLRYVVPGVLNLRKQIEIRVGDGDNSNDICIKVADLVEPYSTQEGFNRIFLEIKELPETAAIERTLANLKTMLQSGELPVFVDDGGMLDSDGNIRDAIHALIRRLAPSDERYIFFVSSRRPRSVLGLPIPVVQLDALVPDETKRLLALIAARAGVGVSASEAAEAAQYIAGYPPAAYFAVEQAKRYGIRLLLDDKRRLVVFRTSIFLKHFAEVSLSKEEQDVLRLLAFYSPLPLKVVAEVIHFLPAVLGDVLMRLIDLALLTTTKDGFYRIADPIADAALNAFGFPSSDLNRAVAEKLAEFLAEPDVSVPMLDLSRSLFRAATLAKQPRIAENAAHLADDLIKLTEEQYHRREYSEAIGTGLTVLEQRPKSEPARSYLIRALTQEERFDEAEEQIREFQKYAPLREVRNLHGFLQRKRGATREAIEDYKDALRLGKRGSAISRELALCHFILGQIDQAAENIAEALKRNPDDRYVVDLWAQIATRQRNEGTAREALARLELIDKSTYYYHRKARIELAFGQLSDARQAARKAAESESSPPFEVLATLTHCEIESGNLPEAETLLARLESKFGHIRSDIRVGLRCKLEIARGRNGDAMAQAERMKAKDSIFYKKIRHDALRGELAHSALLDAVRASYAEEVARLERELDKMSAEQFAPADLLPGEPRE